MSTPNQVPLYCDLCSKEFTGLVPAQQHFVSEAHRRKEDQKKNSVFQSTTKRFWCDPCNLHCNSSDQFAQHIASPRHNEIVKRAFYIPKQVVSEPQESLSQRDLNNLVHMNIPGYQQPATPEKRKEYDFDGNRGYCYLCDIDLTSQQHARQHLSGSKHQKKKKQSEDGDNGMLFCNICSVPFSCSKNAKEHLESSRHIKRKMELDQQEQTAHGNTLNLGMGQQLKSSEVNQVNKPFQVTETLADVPVYSKNLTPLNQPSKVVSTPLTSSITLLDTSGTQPNTYAADQQSSYDPYTFDGKQGYCSICQVDFTSPQNAQQHLNGSKHQKAEKMWKQRGTRKEDSMCELCNVVFSGPECAQQHYASEKHKKRSQLPVTNFTILGPEKPPLAQKVDLVQTHPLTPKVSVLTDLPLNIQPDSEETRGSKDDTSGSLPDMHLVMGQSQSPLAASCNTTEKDQVYDTSVSLSVHGGSFPTPLNMGDCSQLLYGRLQNSGSPSEVPALVQSPGTVGSSVKEYRFDGSRGWCNVCNIELTSQQHANQHLSGKNHAKARGKWQLSYRGSGIPTNGHILSQQQLQREAAVDVQQAPSRPYRFDGNRGWCNVCSIELTSSQHANQHLSGRNHAKALARWETVNSSQDQSTKKAVSAEIRQPYEFTGDRGFCHVCKIELTSLAHARQHLSGKPHEKAAIRWNFPYGHMPAEGASAVSQEQAFPSTGQQEINEEAHYVFTGSRGHCFVCNIELTSQQHATQHLQGRNHARAVERKKKVKQNELYPLECKVCFKSFSGQESAAQHYASAKHKSKVSMKTGFLGNSTLNLDETGLDGSSSPRISNTPSQSPAHPYMCEVCQCPLNSFEQLSIHKKSPNHLRTAEKMNRYVAVNMAADTENQETSSNGGSQDLEEDSQDCTLRKEQYTNLWNALRTGEITTVKGVSANAEPGEIKGSVSYTRSAAPITTASVVAAMGGSDTSNLTHSTYSVSSSTARKSDSCKDTSSVEVGGCHNTELASGNRQVFNPVVGSQLAYLSPERSRRDTVVTTMVTPDITTNILPVRSMFGVVPVNESGSDLLAERNEESDTGESRNRIALAVRHNPLKNQNTVKHRGNKQTLESYDDLDMSEDNPMPRDEGSVADVPDDADSIVSFSSDATSFLNHGAHASHTTDNNPSMASLNKRDGDRSLLSDTESSVYPSSNVDLLSGYSDVGPFPKAPVNNPFKGYFKFYCRTCNRPMNTEKDYKLHLESKSHLQRAAAIEAPVRTDLGQIYRVMTTDNALEEAYTVTKTIPRSYQVGLFCKTMEDDRVIFLPTGTGKTLVSVMTVSCMLKLNPKRPVLFLVDKVLLVLQQTKYISQEIGEKQYKRFSLDGSDLGLQERTLKIATLCGNLLPADSTPLYQHDVIVTTAAYADNLLQKRLIHWKDFSLVVFDEAHHCVKKHPFNRLLEAYHRPCHPEERPKMLGLTASPAGRDSVENTYSMLQELCANLGGATIAIVERQGELQELEKYQSNAELKVDYKPYSVEERAFREKLQEYLCHCYLKLTEYSNLEAECDWGVKRMQRDELLEFAANLDQAARYRFLSVLNSLKPISEDPASKAVFDFLTKHSQIVLIALSDMDGSGIPDAVADLLTLAASSQDSGFYQARTLGLPCDELEEAVKHSAHSAQIHKEFEDNPLHISLYTQLFQTLTCSDYINWKSANNPMALILVKERAHAHRLSNFLKQTQFVAKNDLKVTSVVGHGTGTADGGMKIKQQKRVLDGVKRKRYHIIVATSVAEEGVDIPECELVVCMNPPSTVTGLVQMRGRARKKGSFFVILCKSKDEEEKIKNLLTREKFMMEAAKLCIGHQRDQ